MEGLRDYVVTSSRTMDVTVCTYPDGELVEKVKLSKGDMAVLKRIFNGNINDFYSLQEMFDKYAKVGFKLGLKKAELLLKNASQQ